MSVLLAVENLHVSFSTRHGVIEALHGVGFPAICGGCAGLLSR